MTVRLWALSLNGQSAGWRQSQWFVQSVAVVVQSVTVVVQSVVQSVAVVVQSVTVVVQSVIVLHEWLSAGFQVWCIFSTVSVVTDVSKHGV